jgi:hypothetical protein
MKSAIKGNKSNSRISECIKTESNINKHKKDYADKITTTKSDKNPNRNF